MNTHHREPNTSEGKERSRELAAKDGSDGVELELEPSGVGLGRSLESIPLGTLLQVLFGRRILPPEGESIDDEQQTNNSSNDDANNVDS
jgi:hypothetical protein